MIRVRRRQPLMAIADESLRGILEELGLLAELEAGRMACATCGRIVSFDTVGGLFQVGDEVKVFCSSGSCSMNTADPGKDQARLQ